MTNFMKRFLRKQYGVYKDGPGFSEWLTEQSDSTVSFEHAANLKKIAAFNESDAKKFADQHGGCVRRHPLHPRKSGGKKDYVIIALDPNTFLPIEPRQYYHWHNHETNYGGNDRSLKGYWKTSTDKSKAQRLTRRQADIDTSYIQYTMPAHV